MQEDENKSIRDFLAQFKDRGNNRSGKIKPENGCLSVNTVPEFDKFVNRNISSLISFTVRGFNDYIQSLNFNSELTETLYNILTEMRRLPASSQFHGAYDGGLFDHTLLVANYADKLANTFRTSRTKIDSRHAIMTAIYHDFGKITYQAMKKGLKTCFITLSQGEIESMRAEIAQKFGVEGYDHHIEESLAILKKYKLEYDDEISRAILFHHGGWSYYKPYTSNELGVLIHTADMIASQIYNI